MREQFGEEPCFVDVWPGRLDGRRDVGAAFALVRLRSGTSDGHNHSKENEGHKKRSDLHNRHCLVSSKFLCPISILEAAHAALEFVFYHVGPQPLDYAGVVVAVRQVEAYIGKQGATVPSVRMMTLFWPARQFQSAKRSSPFASRTIPGIEAKSSAWCPFPFVPSPFQPYSFRSSPEDIRMNALISCRRWTEFTIW